MNNLNVTDNEGRLMSLSVIITEKNKKPAIELRALTTNPFLIKTLISAAYRNVPAVFLPTFTNPVQSLNSAIDKGIIYRTEALACGHCGTLAPVSSLNIPCVNCNKLNYKELNRQHYFYTQDFDSF